MSQKSSHSKKSSLIELSEIRDYDTYRVMSLTPLLPYHVVADVGCGSGYLTIPLAKYLFDGKVYAVDNNKDMLDNTKCQMERINLTNISLIHHKKRKLTIDTNSLDGAFADFVVNQFETPSSLLKEIRRCLRKGGWLAVLEAGKQDFSKKTDSTDSKETNLRDIVKELGFRFISRHSLNDGKYMLLSRK